MDIKCDNCRPAIELPEVKKDVGNQRDDIKELYGRIGAVEKETAGFNKEITNLCKQIESLVSTLKWTIGIGITIASVLVAIFHK